MHTFYKKNFLPESIQNYIENLEYGKDVKFINEFMDKEGVFKGTQTSVQEWLNNDSFLVKELKKNLDLIKTTRNHNIDGIQIMTSLKPYDVHTDWVVTNNQITLRDVNEYPPSYTVIIPLMTGDFNTIVFDQGAEYNDFRVYKQNNKILKNYCSDLDFKKYLSHCHSEDQKYLTIKKIFDWHKGDIFGFDRRLFHSASHHKVPKKGIIIWMSYPNDQ